MSTFQNDHHDHHRRRPDHPSHPDQIINIHPNCYLKWPTFKMGLATRFFFNTPPSPAYTTTTTATNNQNAYYNKRRTMMLILRLLVIFLGAIQIPRITASFNITKNIVTTIQQQNNNNDNNDDNLSMTGSATTTNITATITTNNNTTTIVTHSMNDPKRIITVMDHPDIPEDVPTNRLKIDDIEFYDIDDDGDGDDVEEATVDVDGDRASSNDPVNRQTKSNSPYSPLGSTVLIMATDQQQRNKRNNHGVGGGGGYFGRKRSNIINGGFLGKNLYNNSVWQHYLEPWTANPNYWIADRYHDNAVCLMASFEGIVKVRPANQTFRGGVFIISPEESLGRRANCERNSRNIFWKFSQHDEREILPETNDNNMDTGQDQDYADETDEIVDDDPLNEDNEDNYIHLNNDLSAEIDDPDFNDNQMDGLDSIRLDPGPKSSNNKNNNNNNNNNNKLMIAKSDPKKNRGQQQQQKSSKTKNQSNNNNNNDVLIERSNRLLSAGFHVVGSVIEFHVAYIECLQIANRNSITNRFHMRDHDVCTNLSVSFDLGTFGNPQAYECNHIWSKTLKDVHYTNNKRRYAGEVQISLKWVRIDKDPLGMAPYSFRRARRKCVWDTILSWQSLTIIGSLIFFFIVGFFGLCVCSNSSCHDDTGEWSNWCCFLWCCCKRSQRDEIPTPRVVQYNHAPNLTRVECNHHHHPHRNRGPPPPPPPPSSSTSLLTNTSSHPNHMGCGHRKPTFSNSYSYEGTGSNPTQQSSSSAMSTAIDDFYYYGLDPLKHNHNVEELHHQQEQHQRQHYHHYFHHHHHHHVHHFVHHHHHHLHHLVLDGQKDTAAADPGTDMVPISGSILLAQNQLSKCDQRTASRTTKEPPIEVDCPQLLPNYYYYYDDENGGGGGGTTGDNRRLVGVVGRDGDDHPPRGDAMIIMPKRQPNQDQNQNRWPRIKNNINSLTLLRYYFEEFIQLIRLIMLNVINLKYILDHIASFGLNVVVVLVATTNTKYGNGNGGNNNGHHHHHQNDGTTYKQLNKKLIMNNHNNDGGHQPTLDSSTTTTTIQIGDGWTPSSHQYTPVTPT